MSPPMPSVFGAVSQVHRDLRNSLVNLSGLAGTAFLILLASEIISAAVVADQYPRQSRALLLIFIIQCARGFLLTPYLIAVHRFIILGEIATSYAARPRELRFQTFLGWTLALQAVSMLPAFLLQWMPHSATRSSLSLTISLAIMILLLRLSIVFPATAVDSPGATFSDAIADTKGHLTRMVLVAMCACLVVTFPLVALGIIFRIDGTLSLTARGALTAVVVGAADLAIVTLMVAVASRFYLWLGKRTRGAAAPVE